jgi:Protein of unknown function (DUF669)/SAP domain
MTVVKYDLRNVEPGQDFDTPIPVGLYKMKIAKLEEKESKSGNPMLELELEVPSGDFKGRKVWDYIVLNEGSEWKLRQLVDALGLKAKGSLDTNKMQGEVLLVRIKHESNEDYEEGAPQAKVKALLPPKSENGDIEAAEEAEEEETEEESEDLTWADLAEYDRTTLKETIRDNELEIKVTKSMSDDDIREQIAEALELERDEEEEEGNGYAEMSLADLKAELKSRDLKSSGTKKALIARLEKDDESGEDEDEEEPF